MTKLKICGLTRFADVAIVNAVRPDFCGFVLNFPSSPRSLSPSQARALRRELDPAVRPVGVFVNRPVEEVAALLLDGTISVAQLHGGEDPAYIAALQALAPEGEIWQAVLMRTAQDAARAMASPARRVLLDSGRGSGRTFDWTLARQVHRPHLLAGGLSPENLPSVIRSLRPWGVDLSSGVERDGRKDLAKIQAAAAAVREEGL